MSVVICEMCEGDKGHRHKCAYMKVNLPRKVCEDFENEIKLKDQTIMELKFCLNKLEAQLQIFRNVVNSSQAILKPVIENFEPVSFDSIISTSYWDPNVKEANLALFKSYQKYCLENNKKLYDIDNAFIYLKDIKKYKLSTFKHRLRLFIRIFKKALKDPFIETSFYFGSKEPPKIKHLVSTNEIKRFINFLKEKQNFSILLMIEILYKFGVRVGALTKLKVFSYDFEQHIITFKEKNKVLIKRKVLEGLGKRIESLIKSQKLKKDDFLFMKEIFPRNENKRRIYFSHLLIKFIKDSKAFDLNSIECFSAHMFRASLATRVAMLQGSEQARKELNHKSVNTTLGVYVRAEERGLYENLEEDFNCHSEGMLLRKRMRFLESSKEKLEKFKDFKSSSETKSLENKLNKMREKEEDDDDSDNSAYENEDYYDDDENISDFDNDIDPVNEIYSINETFVNDCIESYDLNNTSNKDKRLENKNKNSYKSKNYRITNKFEIKNRKINEKKTELFINKLPKEIVRKFNLNDKKESLNNSILEDMSKLKRDQINKNDLEKWEQYIENNKRNKVTPDINKTLTLKMNIQKNKIRDEQNKAEFFKILRETGRILLDEIISQNSKIYNAKNESQVILKNLIGKNEKIYCDYKIITSQGCYPNTIVKFINEKKGYGVFAESDISAGTLICEYSGILDYYKNVNDTKDVFVLYKTKKLDYDRCINPHKYCNIGRFLNCSNNNKEDNCSTVRVLVKNEAKVLIYSNREIKQKEELLYYYDGFEIGYFY